MSVLQPILNCYLQKIEKEWFFNKLYAYYVPSTQERMYKKILFTVLQSKICNNVNVYILNKYIYIHRIVVGGNRIWRQCFSARTLRKFFSKAITSNTVHFEPRSTSSENKFVFNYDLNTHVLLKTFFEIFIAIALTSYNKKKIVNFVILTMWLLCIYIICIYIYMFFRILVNL